MMSKILRISLSLLVLSLILGANFSVRAQSLRPQAEEIRAFLEAHPRLTTVGAHVIEIRIEGEALIIDISQEILPEGKYDAQIFAELERDLDIALNISQYYMTTFKVGGEFLEYWGRPLPDMSLFETLPPLRETRSTGPLSGYKIALSAGHGWYWSDIYLDWRWQRSEFWGIREDTINAELIRLLTFALTNQGATVIDLREPDPNARTGESGLPAWQEAARHFQIYNDLPSWVWDGSNNNYNSDIRTRPYTANYYGADLLISLHNNGWNGTLTGTETYYDTTADFHDPAQSAALAQAVHNSIINTIRSNYDPAWYSRGLKPSDGGYGETHYADMPAILIELAFMDTYYPDNTYLRDEAFRILAAEAIRDGICTYLGVICDDIPITGTVFSETPQLSPDYGSGMCDSGWYTYSNQRSQNSYITPNVTESAQMSNSAVWQPSLPRDGLYLVEAFIPAHDPITWTCPEFTLTADTTHAIYQIDHAFGTAYVFADQSAYHDQWADLGVYYFQTGVPAVITLSNVSGEALNSSSVSFSTLRFNLVGDDVPRDEPYKLYFPLVTR